MTKATTAAERVHMYTRAGPVQGDVRRLIAHIEALTKERDDLVESYVEALAQVEKHMALHDRECCKLVVSSVATFPEEKL